MKQKLLIIELLLTKSWEFNNAIDVFFSDGYALYIGEKEFDQLQLIAEQLDNII